MIKLKITKAPFIGEEDEVIIRETDNRDYIGECYFPAYEQRGAMEANIVSSDQPFDNLMDVTLLVASLVEHPDDDRYCLLTLKPV